MLILELAPMLYLGGYMAMFAAVLTAMVSIWKVARGKHPEYWSAVVLLAALGGLIGYAAARIGFEAIASV